jgi:hypothetical protein
LSGTLAGCGFSPGDKVMTTGDVIVCESKYTVADIKKGNMGDYTIGEMLSNSGKGFFLASGSTVQIIESQDGAIKIRVTEDGQEPALKRLKSDNTGKVGFADSSKFRGAKVSN